MRITLLLCLIGLVSMTCSCGVSILPPPRAPLPTVSAEVKAEMKAALTYSGSMQESFDRLEKVLKERAKPLHAQLAPGATDEEIAKLRAAIGGKTIEPLEAWFRWHNGRLPKNGQINRMCALMQMGEPLSIEESLEDQKLIRSVGFGDHPHSRYIKLLEDGCGDGYFIDPTSPEPAVFYSMMEDPWPLPMGTVGQLADFIAVGFEQGILTCNENGDLIEDFEKFQALKEAHDDKIAGK